MLRHISVVHNVSIISLGDTGTVQIGDTNSMEAKKRAIAVQRDVATFSDEELPFEAFHIFRDDEITIPTRTTSVRMKRINKNPFICVDNIIITIVSDAATLHIGSIEYVFNNSRIRQIRHFSEGSSKSSPSE